MEDMLTFTGLVVIVFGILQIILFFKIWGMTNDIREIKNKYLGKTTVYSQPEIVEQSTTTNNNPIRIVSILFTLASLMGAYYMPIWIGIAIIIIDIVLLVYAFTRKQ